MDNAAARLIEANRARFDSASPIPGASERHVQALKAELAAARWEAAEARHRLALFETTTIWRATKPLRQVLQALNAGRARPPVPEAPPAPPPGTPVALSYAEWIRTVESACLAALMQFGPGHQPNQPQRLGLVLIGPDAAASDAAPPPGCTRLVLDGADAPPALVAQALQRLDCDLICFMDAQDRLATSALALVALVVAQYPQTDLIFADEDQLDADGTRVCPFFKPGWDAELQRGRDLLGPFVFLRTALVREAVVSSGAAWRLDLANQIAAATVPTRIRHIPAVLCHRRSPATDDTALRAALAANLQRTGAPGRILPVAGQAGCHRVIYDTPSTEPAVSIIVPTRDRADLLRVCAEGVLQRTNYQRLQLLIADNGTQAPDALALLQHLAADSRVQVLQLPGPFNWSALNNAAAAAATGEILVLLNNDIAVLEPDWLTTLVSHAAQPGVGAAGAKLLYPDGRVQHAGLTTDAAGVPRHLFRFAPGDSLGAFGLLGMAREVWGVTGACLATRRDVFFRLGGLNEALPVAYNDVDYCLRLTASGYRIIWTPWSVLEHREMASRPPDHAPARQAAVGEERARLLRDWGGLVLQDPFLNPNLALVDEHPCLSRAP